VDESGIRYHALVRWVPRCTYTVQVMGNGPKGKQVERNSMGKGDRGKSFYRILAEKVVSEYQQARLAQSEERETLKI
jgi:hypothetical protein